MLTLDLEDYNSVVHLESPFIAPPTTLSRLKSFCCLVSSVLREWSALYTTHKMMMTTDSDSILLQSEIFQLYENQCVKKFFCQQSPCLAGAISSTSSFDFTSFICRLCSLLLLFVYVFVRVLYSSYNGLTTLDYNNFTITSFGRNLCSPADYSCMPSLLFGSGRSLFATGLHTKNHTN